MAYSPEELDPLTIEETPRPTGVPEQQQALQSAPNAAPAPDVVDNPEVADPFAPSQQKAEQETATDASEGMPRPKKVGGPREDIKALADNPDAFTPSQVEEPKILHRRWSDPDLENRQMVLDQREAAQQQQAQQRTENQRARNVSRALEKAGVQMDVDPETGASVPRRDLQGRVLYKPLLIDPFHVEQSEDGSQKAFQVKQDIYGNQVAEPLKERLDRQSGHRYVQSADGTQWLDQGPDDDYLNGQQLKAAQQAAQVSKAQAGDIARQLKTLKKQRDDLMMGAADLDPNDKSAEAVTKRQALQGRRDEIDKQISALSSQQDGAMQSAQQAQQDYMQQRLASIDRSRAKLGLPPLSQKAPPDSTGAAFTNPNPEAVGKTLDDLSANPVGFKERLGEMWSNAEFVPYASSGVEIAHLLSIGAAGRRMLQAQKDGTDPDPEDVKLVAQYLARAQRKETWGAKVASIVGQSLSFGGELAIAALATALTAPAGGEGAIPTAGVTIANQAAIKAAKLGLDQLAEKAAREVLTRQVEKVLGKGVLTEIAGKTAGKVAQAAVLTPIASAARISAGVIQDTMPVKFQQDGTTGKIAAMANDDADGFAEAIGKETLNNYIENLSEFSGGIFKYLPGAKVVAGIKAAMLRKLAIDGKLAPFAEKLKNATDKVGKLAAWHHVLPEIGEEYIGGLMHWATPNSWGGQSFDEAVPSLSDLPTMAAAFALPGAFKNTSVATANWLAKLRSGKPVGHLSAAEEQSILADLSASGATTADLSGGAQVSAQMMKDEHDSLDRQINDPTLPADQKAALMQRRDELAAQLNQANATPTNATATSSQSVQNNGQAVSAEGAQAQEEGQGQVPPDATTVQQGGQQAAAGNAAASGSAGQQQDAGTSAEPVGQRGTGVLDESKDPEGTPLPTGSTFHTESGHVYTVNDNGHTGFKDNPEKPFSPPAHTVYVSPAGWHAINQGTAAGGKVALADKTDPDSFTPIPKPDQGKPLQAKNPHFVALDKDQKVIAAARAFQHPQVGHAPVTIAPGAAYHVGTPITKINSKTSAQQKAAGEPQKPSVEGKGKSPAKGANAFEEAMGLAKEVVEWAKKYASDQMAKGARFLADGHADLARKVIEKIRSDYEAAKAKGADAAQNETAPAKADPIFRKALEQDRYRKVFDALKVEIRPGNGVAMAAGHEEKDGKVNYYLLFDAEKFDKELGGKPNLETVVNDFLGEETVHFTQFEAARQEWQAAKRQWEGKEVPFATYFAHYYEGVYGAMNAEEKATAIAAYEKAATGHAPTNPELAAEFVRQLIQREKTGTISEATIRSKPIIERILAVLDGLLKKITDAPKALREAYEGAKRVLAAIEAGGNAEESGTPRGIEAPVPMLAKDYPAPKHGEPDLVLLGCVDGKQETTEAVKAADLYTSQLFKARRAFAESDTRPWMILSAGYGVIEPSKKVHTYDATIAGLTADQRAAWMKGVRAKVLDYFGGDRMETIGKTIELHAGKDYLDAIDEALTGLGINVVPAFQNKGIGVQLSIYKEGYERTRTIGGFGEGYKGNKRATKVPSPSATSEKPKLSYVGTNIGGAVGKAIVDFGKNIDPADLYTSEEGHGLEDNPHVTLLYGLHTQEPAAVAKAIADHGPFRAMLGNISLFKNDKYDVLKFDAKGPGFSEINKTLRTLAHTSDFPDYQPHVTVAYLKPGTGQKYTGANALSGTVFTVNNVEFNDAERNKTALQLSGTQKNAGAPPAATAPADGVGSIYQQQRADGNKWMVQQGEKRGFGDSIHDTEQEAQKESELLLRQNADRAATKKRLEEQSAEEERKKAEREDLGTFTDGMSAMDKGRAVKILTERRQYRGDELTRRDLIRKLVSEGRTIGEHEGQRTLEAEDGTFLGEKALTKTGLDYAAHLIAERDAKNPPSPEDAKAKQADEALGYWWDHELTAAGRYQVAQAAGFGTKTDTMAKVAWRYVSDPSKAKIVAVRNTKDDPAGAVTSKPAEQPKAEAPKEEGKPAPQPKATEKPAGKPVPKASGASDATKDKAKKAFEGLFAPLIMGRGRNFTTTPGQEDDRRAAVKVDGNIFEASGTERAAQLLHELIASDTTDQHTKDVLRAYLRGEANAERRVQEGSTIPNKAGQTLGSPSLSIEQKPIPKDRRAAMMDLADSLESDGITTPEGVARFMDEISDKRGRPFVKALWKVMESTGAVSETASPADWNTVFSEIDKADNGAEATSDETDRNTGAEHAGSDSVRQVGGNEGGGDSGDAAGDRERNPKANDSLLEGEQSGDVSSAGTHGAAPEGRTDSGGRGGATDSGADQSGNEPDRRDDNGGAGQLHDGSAGGTIGTADGTDEPRSDNARGNYLLSDPERIQGGGPKERFRRNRLAIETYQAIVSENRQPTQADLDNIAAYIGWGSFGQELFKGTYDYPRPKPGWEAEDKWLRENLTKAEWEGVQGSIINAHYTAPPVVSAMWDMLRKMGFDGGRVLEPSLGIGNFFGLMPRDLMERSDLTGIELDKVTAGMAQVLYPGANIQQKGYQDSKTADDFYDVAIGNWPFAADRGFADRRYQEIDPTLHDYFFLKAIDQVRPGGIVMGITSSGTMDKKGAGTRLAMSRKADLIGAYRFPSGTFKNYAGTAVVTDLLIFRKKDSRSEEGAAKPNWIDSVELETPNGKIWVNQYFAENPKAVLGKLDFGHGTTQGREGMIVNMPDDFEQRLADLPSKVPVDGYHERPPSSDNIRYVTNNTTDRQGSITTKQGDGGLYVVRGEQLASLDDVAKYKVKSAKETKRREDQLHALIVIRRLLGKLVDQQRDGDTGMEETRTSLRTKYEAFVKDHGLVSDSEALAIMRKVGDPFYPSVASLERNTGSKEKPNYVPSTILTRNTMRAAKKMEKPSVRDAYILARNETLNLDMDRVAELAGVPKDQATEELVNAGAIVRTPVGNYEPMEQYLSGNIRRKMAEAKAAKDAGQDMERNIRALETVMPPTIPYFNIEAKLGNTWTTADDYAAFYEHLLGLGPRGEDGKPHEGIQVNYGPQGWAVRLSDRLRFRPQATTTWGVNYRSVPFNRLATSAMNNQTITVWKRDEDGNRYVDAAETKVVAAQSEKLREEFSRWVWAEADRRARLESAYNDTVNAVADAHYDGSFMQMEGMALERGSGQFSLRQHQQNAIWRGVVLGRGLFAHEVGTGKTYTIAGIAVESRRYGSAQKTIIFGHNANAASVARAVTDMYPGAKVLYLDNLDPESRALKMAQIATDEWDAIVVPHSLIDRFTLKPETLEEMAREEIADLEAAAIEAAEDDGQSLSVAQMDSDDKKGWKSVKSATAKELVKQRNRIKQKIQEAALKAREGAIFFEDLGIDQIIVDESHIFKKPPIASKMQMKGLNKEGSGRSINLKFLTDYVTQKRGGKGVHLFTGTPITNTLNEIFNMQRYFMSDVLKRDGLAKWDAWFNTFASGDTDAELSAAGDYEAVTRLASFDNVAELRRMVGEFMDVVLAKNMPEMQPRQTKSGKVLTDPTITDAEKAELLNGRTENAGDRPYKRVVTDTYEMSAEQKRIRALLAERARRFRDSDGKGRWEIMKKGLPESPVIVETDAANTGLDQRLFDPKLADDPNSKVNRAIRNALRHYNEEPESTQVFFMERGFSDMKSKSLGRDKEGKSLGSMKIQGFNVAKDLVDKLVAGGVPSDQIAIVDGSVGGDRRLEIADLMNSGKIRFVIGSTATLGTGVNMQKNLRAMHHLDAPWTPGELEQRNGRGFRQENQWNTVLEYRYITEGIDGRRWQVLLKKDKFIRDFLEADLNTRTISGDAVSLDDKESAGDIADTFGKAAGDPRLIIKAKLTKEVEKLEDRARTHSRGVVEMGDQLDRLRKDIEWQRKESADLQDNADTYAKAMAETPGFAITIQGKKYTDREEADKALTELEPDLPPHGKFIPIANYRGFQILGGKNMVDEPMLVIAGKKSVNAKPSLGSLDAYMRSFKSDAEGAKRRADEKQSAIAGIEEAMGKPFGRAEELNRKRKQLEDLTKDINEFPAPAPGWLREGAPTGTVVYVNGKPRTVAGQRWSRTNWFVMVEGDNGLQAIAYDKITDENGIPVFEKRPFETPLANQGKANVPPTPNGYKVGDRVTSINYGDWQNYRITDIIPPADQQKAELGEWKIEVENERNGQQDILKADDSTLKRNDEPAPGDTLNRGGATEEPPAAAPDSNPEQGDGTPAHGFKEGDLVVDKEFGGKWRVTGVQGDRIHVEEAAAPRLKMKNLDVFDAEQLRKADVTIAERKKPGEDPLYGSVLDKAPLLSRLNAVVTQLDAAIAAAREADEDTLAETLEARREQIIRRIDVVNKSRVAQAKAGVNTPAGKVQNKRGELKAPTVTSNDSPTGEHVSKLANELLSEEERDQAARDLGEAKWSKQADTAFRSALADWIVTGKAVTAHLVAMFKRIMAKARSGFLSVAVAFSMHSQSGVERGPDLRASEVAPKVEQRAAQVAEPNTQEPETAPPVERLEPEPPKAAESPAPVPPAKSERHADFGGALVSKDARTLAEWVTSKGDNEAKVFAIADKQDGSIYFFDQDGKLVKKAPALFGKEIGDVLHKDNRITPSGRFETEFDTDPEGHLGRVLNYEDDLDDNMNKAIHRLYLEDPSEHRPQRLASQDPRQHRISWGCINLDQKVMDGLVLPLFESTDGGVVYVMPETAKGRELFSTMQSAREGMLHSPAIDTNDEQSGSFNAGVENIKRWLKQAYGVQVNVDMPGEGFELHDQNGDIVEPKDLPRPGRLLVQALEAVTALDGKERADQLADAVRQLTGIINDRGGANQELTQVRNLLMSPDLNQSPAEQPPDPREVLVSAYKALPDTTREVIARRARGDSLEDIARDTRKTPEAVEKTYRDGLAQLQRAKAALANIKSTFSAVQAERPPNRTMGRPDLANPARGEQSRLMVDTVDEIRNLSGVPETKSDELTQDQAHKLWDDLGPRGVEKMLYEKAKSGALLNDVETLVAKRLVASQALTAVRQKDEDAMLHAAMVIDAYRMTGTEWGRAGRQRSDQYATPAERFRQYIAESILTPDAKRRQRMEKAKDPAERAKVLEEWVKKVGELKKKLAALGFDLDTMTDEQLTALLRDRTRAKQVVSTIATSKADAWDGLYEYWVSAILSAPSTNVANIMGNVGNAAWDFTAQRFTEAVVNAAVRDQKSAQFGEFRWLAHGIAPGLTRAWRMARSAWTSEAPTFQEEVIGEPGAMKVEETRGHAIPGKLGRIVRMPLRFLLAADEFSKSLFGTMQVHAEAYRIAKAEGLTGQQMADRIAQLATPQHEAIAKVIDTVTPPLALVESIAKRIANRRGGDPADLVRDKDSLAWIMAREKTAFETITNQGWKADAWNAAVEKAVDLAFQNELGNLGQGVIHLRNETPGLRYFLPFVKTAANIFSTGTRKSPLGSAALLYRAIRTGFVRMNWSGKEWSYSRADFVKHSAEQVLAWGLMYGLASLVKPPPDEDFPFITGTTPYKGTQRGARDLAYRTAPPQSVRIGNEWYSYSRIEPFATTIATVVDLLHHMQDQEKGRDVTQVIGSLYEHLVSLVKDKTFAKGIGDVLNAIQDGQSTVEWAGNFVTSWVPNIIRASARESDPNLHETRTWGKGTQWLNQFGQRTAYKALPTEGMAPPVKMDIWGRPVIKDAGMSPATDWLFRMFTPSKTQKTDNIHPLDRLITNWNNQNPNDTFAPELPAPYWSINRTLADGRKKSELVYMTDREYNRFLKLAGTAASNSLQAEGWNPEHPTPAMVDKIAKTLSASRKAARARVWQERLTSNLAGNGAGAK